MCCEFFPKSTIRVTVHIVFKNPFFPIILITAVPRKTMQCPKDQLVPFYNWNTWTWLKSRAECKRKGRSYLGGLKSKYHWSFKSGRWQLWPTSQQSWMLNLLLPVLSVIRCVRAVKPSFKIKQENILTWAPVLQSDLSEWTPAWMWLPYEAGFHLPGSSCRAGAYI